MLKLENSKTILWMVKLAPKLRIESILLAVFDQELPATAGCPHPRAAAEPDPWFLCSNLPSLLRASLSLLFFVPPSPCRDIDSMPASVWPVTRSPVDQCPMVSEVAWLRPVTQQLWILFTQCCLKHDAQKWLPSSGLFWTISIPARSHPEGIFRGNI